MSESFGESFLTRMAEVTDLILIDKSELAMKFKDKDGRTFWLPRSQISYIKKGANTPEGREVSIIHIPDWLAEKHNL